MRSKRVLFFNFFYLILVIQWVHASDFIQKRCAFALETGHLRREAVQYLLNLDQKVHANAFNTGRTLFIATAAREHNNDVAIGTFLSYEGIFGLNFINDLRTIRSGGHIIDVGGGKANWVFEYFENAMFVNHAKVTSITVSEPARTEENAAKFMQLKERERESFRYLTGHYIEDPDFPFEIEKGDLLIDAYGALYYSPRIDLVMQRYGDLLLPGGKVYMRRPHDKVKIKDSGGSAISLNQWLRSIRGFDVLQMPNDDSWGGGYLYRSWGKRCSSACDHFEAHL